MYARRQECSSLLVAASSAHVVASKDTKKVFIQFPTYLPSHVRVTERTFLSPSLDCHGPLPAATDHPTSTSLHKHRRRRCTPTL